MKCWGKGYYWGRNFTSLGEQEKLLVIMPHYETCWPSILEVSGWSSQKCFRLLNQLMVLGYIDKRSYDNTDTYHGKYPRKCDYNAVGSTRQINIWTYYSLTEEGKRLQGKLKCSFRGPYEALV